MRHDEIIGKVQALAHLPDRGSTERATQSVLRTLAERLPTGLADHLAAQLPPDLAAHIRETTASATSEARPSGAGEPFDLTAFAGRVAVRAGTTEETALRYCAAVLEVLDAAVSPEEMRKLTDALPADIRELLPAGRADEPPA
ncbi:DUF2267 domain-containing protein [Streptomyces sp. NL15-2K]|uniref:DUF2267 domain-containing protein n=1 Tax=Streptomyces sp. NL15-2K TaxID=376149 RepID=UPI000F581436|nr:MULTISPECIES: DUF2267 domain-containing protein [Actinomycetes]WKX06398.1 DUF2267 domain-containing protein [Kutzneria buriramensis]GCB43397.1 hypothetical protein SNL152K_682 [Streptomyces sp. NL15-2K]